MDEPMKQCDKDLLYRKVKVISEGRDTWYAVVNHNTFFAPPIYVFVCSRDRVTMVCRDAADGC